MSDFSNFDDFFRVGRDEILLRSEKLSKESVERKGSDVNAMVAAGAAMADEVMAQVVRTAAMLYLDTAEARDLDRLVFDRYGLVRKPAAPALGTVQFTTTATVAVAFLISAGTTLQSSDGVQFQTIADATFPAGSTGPLSVNVRSVLAGLDQQVKLGKITTILSTISGAPSDLVVNNSAATAGASDEESDASLRARARQFFVTAQKATLRAIEARALEVTGVATATAFEALDSLGRPARMVGLVVSDTYTDQLATLDTIPASYSAQSSALAETVFNSLSDTRAAGIYVQVSVAQVLLQSIQLALSFQAGADSASVTAQARAVLVALINNLQPGATLTRSSMVNVLRSVLGLIITGNEIVTPAVDVTVTPLQVVRTSTALVQVVSSTFNVPTTAPLLTLGTATVLSF